MRRIVLLLAMLVGLAGWLPGAQASDPAAAPRDRATEKLRELKRRQLGPALKVDQPTVDRLLEVERQYQPANQRVAREMAAEWGRLQRLMKQPAPPEGEVRALMESVRQKRRELLILRQRQFDEQMALLTPVQQARYLNYLMKLRKQLAREARQLKSGGGERWFWRPWSQPEVPTTNTQHKGEPRK